MGKRLYVGNLPYNAGESAVRAIFEQNGRRVKEVRLITDRETGRPRGFGFVEMITDDDAKAAIKELSGYSFGGRPLTVNEAHERGPDSPGGGGPGSRSGPPR